MTLSRVSIRTLQQHPAPSPGVPPQQLGAIHSPLSCELWEFDSGCYIYECHLLAATGEKVNIFTFERGLSDSPCRSLFVPAVRCGARWAHGFDCQSQGGTVRDADHSSSPSAPRDCPGTALCCLERASSERFSLGNVLPLAIWWNPSPAFRLLHPGVTLPLTSELLQTVWVVVTGGEEASGGGC